MTAWFKINHHGMRADQDYPYQKPPGTKRIISLGDSYTIGYEVSADQTFSSVIERRLREAGTPCEVLNCGVSGFSNAEECLYLERELMKYDPDLVMVSFCGNDLADNIRSNLFALQNGRLVNKSDRYVPAGRLGNFLNSNWMFNFLSERSNAFAMVKERLTGMAKREMIAENVQNLRSAQSPATSALATRPSTRPAADSNDYQRKLCAAILNRIYDDCQKRHIPLVIHSVATGVGARQDKVVEMFPLSDFDVNRPGLYFVSSKSVLEPYAGSQPLYFLRSHYHWTPFSHAKMGDTIADVIMQEKLLK
jgi:lysophospholipase L1-like esterase